MNNTIHQQYLEACNAIAREAGALIMTYFSGVFTTQRKEDNSPVTDADIAANTLITKALLALTPAIPIIAEEDEVAGAEGHARFWLVDPLDGTRSFVRGEPEFTVNIALIENHQPVLGVIYLPPLDRLYYGHIGHGAFRIVEGGSAERIEARTHSPEGLVVTRSRSHPSASSKAYMDQFNVREVIASSSSSKFCSIAEGIADLYPRFGRTMEWDTAAGHAILQAAGGRVETVDGKPLRYGKPGYENPAFIAFGK